MGLSRCPIGLDSALILGLPKPKYGRKLRMHRVDSMAEPPPLELVDAGLYVRKFLRTSNGQTTVTFRSHLGRQA